MNNETKEHDDIRVEFKTDIITKWIFTPMEWLFFIESLPLSLILIFLKDKIFINPGEAGNIIEFISIFNIIFFMYKVIFGLNKLDKINRKLAKSDNGEPNIDSKTDDFQNIDNNSISAKKRRYKISRFWLISSCILAVIIYFVTEKYTGTFFGKSLRALSLENWLASVVYTLVVTCSL